MTTTAQPKMKAYVSKFTIHLGPITMNGRLISVKTPGTKTAKAPFVMATPDGKPVEQRYIEKGNPAKMYLPGELTRAVQTETGLAPVAHAGVVAETKKSDLPDNVLNLTVHNSDDVDSALFPAEFNAYVFEPDASDPVNLQWHSLMLALLDQTAEYTLIGVCNLRNTEGLYRLVVWRNRLVVQRMMYPADVHDHGPLEKALTVDLDKKTVTKARKMLASLNAPFVADTYVDATREKLATLADVVAASGGVTVAEPVKAEKKPVGINLDDALDAFV